MKVTVTIPDSIILTHTGVACVLDGVSSYIRDHGARPYVAAFNGNGVWFDQINVEHVGFVKFKVERDAEPSTSVPSNTLKEVPTV